MSNLDLFETRLLANRLIASSAIGYQPVENDLAWHVLDEVIPHIEKLEDEITQLRYIMEVLNGEGSTTPVDPQS